MNTDRLAQMYDRLTAKERLSLILAAEKRGDEAEQRRLSDSAPIVHYGLPHHLLRTQAVHVLTLVYVTEQLEHLANYWHAQWRLKGTDPDPLDDFLLIREVSAYVFVQNAEAWRRFCDEEHIDPDQLTAGNYLGWMLGYCTPEMPAHAPTAEELMALLTARGRPKPVLVTADRLLAKWRNALNVIGGGSSNRSETGFASSISPSESRAGA